MENGFPSTIWPLVRSAATEIRGTASPKSLNELLSIYRRPLIHWLKFRMGFDEPEAEDVLHDFVLKRVMKGDLISQADPVRGRFRNWLLVSLKNFSLQQKQYDTRRKRHPSQGIVSLDSEEQMAIPMPISDELTPEFQFEANWAMATLREALLNTREQCIENGQRKIWEVLRSRVLDSSGGGQDPLSYESLVEKFGFAIPQHVGTALTTAQRRLRKNLRNCIARFAADEEEILAEMKRIREVLENPAAWKDPDVSRFFDDL